MSQAEGRTDKCNAELVKPAQDGPQIENTLAELLVPLARNSKACVHHVDIGQLRARRHPTVHLLLSTGWQS